jgi:hypothetical protein
MDIHSEAGGCASGAIPAAGSAIFDIGGFAPDTPAGVGKVEKRVILLLDVGRLLSPVEAGGVSGASS